MTGSLYHSVARADDAEGLIRELDASNPETRQAVLATVHELFDNFLKPATELLSPSDDDPAHLRFDPSRIAGVELSGLVLGLLEQDYPCLQPPPADGDLCAVLHSYGIEIKDAERRTAFFRAWMAERAARLVRLLLQVIEDNLPDQPAQNAAELNRLRQLLKLRLPGMERFLIESLLERRSKAG